MDCKDINKEVLIKLGAAIYIHKKLAEDASKAAKATEYLRDKGVFKKCTK